MREFTSEEKEKIINTPITLDCFDMAGFENLFPYFEYEFNRYILELNKYREWASTNNCVPEKDRIKYFNFLVRLLPNSYKVVNLVTERKDKRTNS